MHREQLERNGLELLKRLDPSTLAMAVTGLQAQFDMGGNHADKAIPRDPAMEANGASDGRTTRPGEITLENLEECLTYQKADPDQLVRMDIVREATVALGKAIVRCVDASPDKDRALQALRLCRMHANAAISLRGRF